MVLIWAGLVVAKVVQNVADIRHGISADDDWADTEGAPLTVAEAVSQACAVEGLNYPKDDAVFLAVLARDGIPVALDAMPYGALVELVNGRLGLYVNGGVVESHGAGLSVVPAEPGRWVRAWLLPGVAYMEGVA